MIIDFNAHVGYWTEQNVGLDAIDIETMLSKAGIEKAVVSSIGEAFEPGRLHSSFKVETDRLIRFRSVGPETQISELESVSGTRGVRIYPTYQSWDFEGEMWNDMLALARDRSWVVQVYTRLKDPRILEQKHPAMDIVSELEKSIDENGDISFVISGLVFGEALKNETLLKKPNVWMDTAHLQHPIHSLDKLIDVVGKEHILFGTNAPFFYPYTAVFRALNAKASDADKRRILSENAERVLEL